MDGRTPLDTSFDMRTDARGKDPDSRSATLRRYHRLLWSKALPNGETFELDAKLHHNSDLGEFWLASDSVVHTYTGWGRPARLATIIHELPPEETTAFYDLACTVGAYLVFPSQVRVDGHCRPSINQRRGIHHLIRDRFDLTLECIRRHYMGATSPLSEVFAPYANFFGLFGDFSGYVDYFLLDILSPTVQQQSGSSRSSMTSRAIPCQRAAWPSIAGTWSGRWTSSTHEMGASPGTPLQCSAARFEA